MIVTLWRWRNRRGAPMGIQALRLWTTRIFRYRLIGRNLLGNAALRLAFRQRRHGRHRGHRRTGGAPRDRRLALFVAAAEADIGEPLQQRQPALRMLLLGLAASLANLGLGRHRQVLEFRHPRRADRWPLGGL